MKMYKYLAALVLSVGLPQSVYSSPWPVGVADNVTAKSNQRVFIPVLENDSGEALTLIEINKTTASLGSVEMDAYRKAVYYKSAKDFTGDDSFWYAFKDSDGRTNATQVFLKVAADNNEPPPPNYEAWPVANSDTAEAKKNQPINISVLRNDVGEQLSLTEVNGWTVKGGRASIQGGSILYSPRDDFTGEDSFWYVFTDARGRANSTKVTVTVVEDTDADTAEVDTEISQVLRIAMHTDFLKNQHALWGEIGGTNSLRVTQSAPVGSSRLSVSGDFTLLDNQLISYQSTDGQYYTVVIDRVRENTIDLKAALPAPIAAGGKVWNFYRDGSHPNRIGFYSLADFALRNSDMSELNTGKHIMLGDSWFSSGDIQNRLSEKLNNAQIVNKGVGGKNSEDILDSFDLDVANESPDVVWLIAGTNDYYQGVSADEYVGNMEKIIEKIKAIGAKAVVFDSSVAPMMFGSASMIELSHQYAKDLENLLSQ